MRAIHERGEGASPGGILISGLETETVCMQGHRTSISDSAAPSKSHECYLGAQSLPGYGGWTTISSSAQPSSASWNAVYPACQ